MGTYVGRVVAVGRTTDDRVAVMYRVSSRSFPNREARLHDGAVAIVPRAGSESDIFRNPYIAYNCLRVVGDYAIVGNGSHTDPVAEKIAQGASVRDAMALALLTLDFEKDQYGTPRIAAAVRRGEGCGVLGVVRSDGIEVVRVALERGECAFVATYGMNRISADSKCSFDARTPADGAAFILGKGTFAEMTHPVVSACALECEDGFQIAVSQP